jgi:hypothetical protein
MPDTSRYLDIDALCADHDRDEVFELLSNNRRRSVLYTLYRNGEDVELPTLVSEVAARETGRPAEELDESTTQSMYISLYQTHLPKLDSFGLVDYDGDERVVSLTPLARRVMVTGDQLSPPRWHRYYALLFLVGLLGVVVVWLANGLTDWRLVSLLVLSGLGGVVAVHSRADDCPAEGSYLLLKDLV